MTNARGKNANAPLVGASHAGLPAQLRWSGDDTDRATILTFRPTRRKSPSSLTRTRSTAALSIKIIEAVRALTLSSTDKLVLLVLASYADIDHGRCWPSIATLCQGTGLAKRAVNNSLKRLKEAGHVEVIHRHRHSNIFTVHHVHPGVHHMHPTPAPRAPMGAPRAPRTVKESSSEQLMNLRAEVVKNDGEGKAPETEVMHRKQPKRSEEYALEALARDLCFRTKMGTESWPEYAQALDRFAAQNEVTVACLRDAAAKRRAKQ